MKVAEFHPDGLVLAIGLENGVVIIYDIRTQEKAISLDGPNSSSVKNIQFSNKGFQIAVCWENSDICRVYSLHKQCEFVEIKHAG